LDVLVEHLMNRKEFLSCFDAIHKWNKFDVSQAHDALYDAKNALALFSYIINDMLELIKKYPVLSNFVKKNTWLYNKMLFLQADRSWKKNWLLELPNLEKRLPKDISLSTKLNIDLDKFETNKRYYIGNVDIESFIQGVIWSNKDVVFSFSSIAKLNIVKKYDRNKN
jgi:hypothetical protein